MDLPLRLCNAVHMLEKKDPSPSAILRSAIECAAKKSGLGVRAFERACGLPRWSLRGILDAGRQQVPSLDRASEICVALGLELYIGPPRATPQSSVAEEQASYRPTIKEQTPPAALEDARITTRISWLKSYWLDLNGTGRKALCTRWDSYFPEWKEEGQALCAPPSPPDNANALWKD